MPPVVPWTNQSLVLYHGTSRANAERIARNGVDIGRSRDFSDFGKGYYCTTNRKIAEEWADKKFRRKSITPALVKHSIERIDISKLTTLSFVRGDPEADDFWSFVHSCRGYGLHRASRVPAGLQRYDVVFGPITLWPQHSIKNRADQVSFHTGTAQDMLNNQSQRSMIELW